MTPKEYEVIPGKMTEEEFARFKRQFGGDGNRESYVRGLIEYPKHEFLICQILGVPTEADKAAANADAVTAEARRGNELAAEANQIARAANMLSRRSNKIAWLAFGFSIVTLFITVLSLLFTNDTPPAANPIPSQTVSE